MAATRSTPTPRKAGARKPAAKRAVAKSPAAAKPAAKRAVTKSAASGKPAAKRAVVPKTVTRKATPRTDARDRAPAPARLTKDPGAAAPRQLSAAMTARSGGPLHRGLGVALLGLAGAGRFAGGHPQVVAGPGEALPAEPVLDVALGALDLALAAVERVGDATRERLNPVLARAWAPAAGPVTGSAGAGLRLLAALTEPLAERGRRLRADAEHEAAVSVAAVLPETIQLVMEQLDLTELAINHVDMERVLVAANEQVDMTGFAIDNMDLQRLIEASLDAVDFTGLAVDRLDFARAVTAALEQIDMMTVARDQLDPTKVAAYLRENIDLGEVVRTAPGAVAGEAVRGVRDTVGRIVPGRR